MKRFYLSASKFHENLT